PRPRRSRERPGRADRRRGHPKVSDHARDRIAPAGMVSLARQGVSDGEKVEEQRLEVDVERELDTRAAAARDDLTKTVDYRGVYELTRQVIEETSPEPAGSLRTA